MWKCTWYSVWIDQEHNQIVLDQHLKIEDIFHRQFSAKILLLLTLNVHVYICIDSTMSCTCIYKCSMSVKCNFVRECTFVRNYMYAVYSCTCTYRYSNNTRRCTCTCECLDEFCQMRRKKERSKQGQTNKQGKATQHTQGSHFS